MCQVFFNGKQQSWVKWITEVSLCNIDLDNISIPTVTTLPSVNSRPQVWVLTLFMPFLFNDLSWGLSWVIWTFWLVLRHNENVSYHLVDANLLLSPFAFWSWPLKYDLQILSHLWQNEKAKSLHQNMMMTAIKWFEFAWGQSTKGKTKRQFWDSNQFNRKHESTIIWKG